MGTENSNAASDKGIQNLSRSDIMSLQFKKESYYEGQRVEGTIILEPRQNIVMNDILIKFKQSEYFVYVVDEKNTVSDLNSQTFFEKKINAGEFLNMGGNQMISLTPGSYKIPFQFTLPHDIPPSFEYPFKNRRASLRYTFSAELLSPYVKSLTEQYIWIKARPINIPSQIKHENYVNVKNVGIVSRGKSGVALFTMQNNYRMNDLLPFTIDIYNEECHLQVKEVKISIKRIVTFMKGGKEYQKRTAILRKRYPCFCDKNSKNSFHYDDIQIRDNDFKDVDFNKSLNPYPFIDDLNLLMPNCKTNLIKCEYSLKATSYFDLSVLGKDRPRVEIPIYITHQLQNEFQYEKDTNQNNGQGQEFAQRDFNRGFESYANNNNFGNNNNNNWGSNSNNFGNNNNNFGNNNNNNFGNNNFGNNNNNNFGNNNNNATSSTNNTSSISKSSTLNSSQKFSYEAYIASKKMNNPGGADKNKNNNNNNSWKSQSSFNNYNNNNNWSSSSNFGNNNYGNNNNNNWGNNNNFGNNNYGNNNNGNNNNNPFGNNNNNYGGGNNYNPGSYGGGFNGSANPFGGGNNDFPTYNNLNNNNQSSNPFGNNNNNQPSNPFGNNNNGPSNPFGNNNNGPSNPFGDNNNSGNPSNPFGGPSGGSGPYQNSYPGF